MANNPQSKKRARQTERRYAVNKARRSRIRTYPRPAAPLKRPSRN
jgi:small subunit ribosomal protein S20